MTLTWRKSTYSGAGQECVEMARAGDHVLVRNSNRPGAGTLAVTPAQLGTWLADLAG